ncbi:MULTISPECIES: tryptophan synthase subunit alpha [Myroides]|uniref:Tryptophan synthase alpha chain n=2 Tax=Myroides odoratimimus TaxID=76832 RepID=A0A0S7EA68_9FLAO|nr:MULTISPECIES: tryptophan synthase subunit alpha [Myroides]AJA68529.1 tryptophan synthase, alpha chain [Myroides sp. A21]ALU25806.1 tryptophan synthase subunit alpha [Myroides odoratimimus]EHO11311.1 tryptophan synthase, alpha subunit [Myroides odoratimimus CCUG 10230]EHO14480.1 tryptophan synthase, alpha subunit [Myroides odoratimimus CCUG 12901]EPH10568.1 tryptophan synthase, alpha subunit [Myroides odoratimimus CCUG 12700]
MNNRINTLFTEKKSNILSIYFTAGYPAIEDTMTILKNLDNAGVDLVEIGMPFSDPLADGPVIQHSSEQALLNGITVSKLFEQLKEMRQHITIPVVLMGYLNPVLRYGVEAFIAKCAEVGVDGIILPDLPMDYYLSHFKTHCDQHNVSNIMLISNDTSIERVRHIDEQTNGFIYLVSSNGTTGSNKSLEEQQAYYKYIQDLKLKNPALIGFGVRDKHTYNLTNQYSSGAIIGTAFMKHINEHGISEESIHNFIKSIR